MGGARAEHVGVVPALHPFALLDLNNLLVRSEALSTLVTPGRPQDTKDASRWDSMTVEGAYV